MARLCDEDVIDNFCTIFDLNVSLLTVSLQDLFFANFK